ncbi:hypothetical protein SEPCBS119000_002834 [Sporothrix epigloea]|uniref:PB1 domain-containing protein n=1 Tax=Sporothrix epigloea TaxID=1892477 RepID=A0ABP0DI96_9PEZI
MSLKQEIETWVAALSRYDDNNFDEALVEFGKIPDTSKILFNMGVIHATLGEHEKAVECYQRAVRLDQYLAVAYFQQGVSNFLLGDFEEALANFNNTLLYLRGNTIIDYAQLGLLFKLYSCEALFNRGLCYIYLQQKDAGMQDLSYAAKEKVVQDHNVIDEAISEEAEGYTVFSIPVGVLYRPNEAKVRNLKTKDYLGKARLVAASDRANAFTGFAGSEAKSAAKLDAKDDRPADNISYAATNLVKPDIQSRSLTQSRRLQSEPPIGRSSFPPTPPPENDRQGSISRGASGRLGPHHMPAKLNMDRIPPNDRYQRTFSPQDHRPRHRHFMSEAPPRAYPQRGPPPKSQQADDHETCPDEVYEMYGVSGSDLRGSQSHISQISQTSHISHTTQNTQSTQKSRRYPTRYIEEDEGGSDYYDDGSFDEGDFETFSDRRGGTRFMPVRTQSRRPEISKIRVKAHADDVRYIMIDVSTDFSELADRVRKKFDIAGRFKMTVRDDDSPESDMVTVSDQDDLEVIVMSAKSAARKQRLDIGKLEIWIKEL